jgi:ribonuclease HI
VQVTATLGVACTGTRGTGAWVAVLIALGRERVVQGKTEGETANRLHLLAAVGALRALRMPVSIDIKTPSSYLRDGVLEVPTWKNRGWRTSTGKPVRNRDLWDELCLALAGHEVRFVLPHRNEEEEDVTRAKALAQGALD